jgi:hypothetical protein
MAVAGGRPSMHAPPVTAVDANRRIQCPWRQRNLDAGGCPDEGVRRTVCRRCRRTPRQCPRCVRNCGRLAMRSGRLVSTAGTTGPQVVSGRLRNCTLRRCPLSAAASGTAAGVHRGHCGQPGYRKRSPARRPLDGCRHCQ